MTTKLSTCAIHVFRGICISLAISMTIFCINDYYKNEDTTTVSYKSFNEDNNPYPQFNLCLMDFSPESTMLIENGYNIDSMEFHRFYSGKKWDNRMLILNRKQLVTRQEDNVIDSCISGHHGKVPLKRCKDKDIVTIYLAHNGLKCYSFHYPEPTSVSWVSIWLKMPLNIYGVNAFSLPNQLINVNNRWIQNTMKPNSSTDFYLLDLEYYRHRNKSSEPCRDWKDYDRLIMEDIYSTVGCRPFYAHEMKNIANCTTKEEIKRIYEMADDKTNLDSPCIELRKYRADVITMDSNITKEDQLYSGIEQKLKAFGSWFRVKIHFPENTHKDIWQMKAYTIQSLIGNVGGYVGIFIGCTISDLPNIFLDLYKRMK